MEVKTILILLVLNIALPTLDTITDINLVIKLYRGAHYCGYDKGSDTEKCKKDPDGYCSNEENNKNVCTRSRGYGQKISDSNHLYFYKLVLVPIVIIHNSLTCQYLGFIIVFPLQSH